MGMLVVVETEIARENFVPSLGEDGLRVGSRRDNDLQQWFEGLLPLVERIVFSGDFGGILTCYEGRDAV